MDDQRDARAIWLGHLLMQSFLARWLVRSDLPTDELQNRLTNLEPRLPFPDLCCNLSLQFPLPGTGKTARDNLYLFLGTAYQAYPATQMTQIQQILEDHLQQIPDPLAPSSPSEQEKPETDSDLARYTSLLKEMGDIQGVVPQHAETMLQQTPPVWRGTASYRGVSAVGEGKGKKEARHRASKEVYLLLQQ
ncbi:double-stranded RNA binding motif domain-containing protein [Aspergillus glaucus CBS 516.65]|uniref:DRBM domain-containing protein n=1 Tax=Aspergillus glaucus CBS 516.65 TaxID=1160497 RepID=A0A1L9V8Q9_ASPGL|nr:hypothetical protein ASPGLDRAFT_39023 [Aspergillus glaucus CBS 516.65]OJJ80324.1 hypothetical protein ASPGLDRAFT_39023 [Aspergillus glaucus CBS 516.65]